MIFNMIKVHRNEIRVSVQVMKEQMNRETEVLSQNQKEDSNEMKETINKLKTSIETTSGRLDHMENSFTLKSRQYDVTRTFNKYGII